MGRKDRKRAQREAQAEAAQAAEPTPKQTFETKGEANAALRDAARVINMNEKKREEARREAAKKPLPALPKLPKARKARSLQPCACGCGEETTAVWAPGHDSYVRGWAIRVERKVVAMKDVPSDQQAAVRKMMKERAEKEAEKAKTSAKGTTADVEEDEDEDEEDDAANG